MATGSPGDRRGDMCGVLVSEHTPIPWRACGAATSHESPPDHWIDDANGKRIARVYRRASGKNDTERLANARLIESAPDLLSALEGLLGGPGVDAWAAARDAIKRARGQS